MIGRASGFAQDGVGEAQGLAILAVPESVDDPHRVVLGDIFVQRLREEDQLVAVGA